MSSSDVCIIPAVLLPAQAAEYIQVSERTLRNWRCQGKGPLHIRLGDNHARVGYRRVDLDNWLATLVVG